MHAQSPLETADRAIGYYKAVEEHCQRILTLTHRSSNEHREAEHCMDNATKLCGSWERTRLLLLRNPDAFREAVLPARRADNTLGPDTTPPTS